jgi:acyl-CoA reductase-like NAD-dependent aldehyde dehydrogenase
MSLTEDATVSLRNPDRFFIGGAWAKPSSPAQFEVINPTTEEVFLRVAEAQAEDMAAAVTAAREAFDRGPWPRLSHAERAEYLRAIAGALDERSVPLSRIWSSQMGVLHTIARGGSAGFGGTYRYNAGLADDFPFVERHEPKAGGKAGFLVREPVGVVGARPRRRRPCWPVARSFSRPPPKHLGRPMSWPRSPRPSDCRPGSFNVVTADRPVSELLVRDPRVDKISFTGSTAAGWPTVPSGSLRRRDRRPAHAKRTRSRPRQVRRDDCGRRRCGVSDEHT